MEMADIEIRQAVTDVRQSSITDTTRLNIVDQVATQMNTQKDLAKSLARILSNVDVFVGLIDELSSVSL